MLVWTSVPFLSGGQLAPLGGRCGGVWRALVNLVCPPSPVEVECVVPSLSSDGSLVSVAASDRGSAARADLLPDVKH